MDEATHVALIRGINVGGRRPVPMERLRQSLSERGLSHVRTYIQSGNVIADAGSSSEADVASLVEATLRQDFDVETVVVVVAAQTLARTVKGAPPGFGSDPDTFLSDVAFIRAGINTADAVAAFGVREGVDTVWAGQQVVYFQRVSAERARSRMSKVISSPLYADMTIRNWKTVTTLHHMVAG